MRKILVGLILIVLIVALTGCRSVEKKVKKSFEDNMYPCDEYSCTGYYGINYEDFNYSYRLNSHRLIISGEEGDRIYSGHIDFTSEIAELEVDVTSRFGDFTVILTKDYKTEIITCEYDDGSVCDIADPDNYYFKSFNVAYDEIIDIIYRDAGVTTEDFE